MSKAVPLRARSAKAPGPQVQCSMHGSPGVTHTSGSEGDLKTRLANAAGVQVHVCTDASQCGYIRWP